MSPLAGAGLALVLSLVLCPVALWWLRQRGVIDTPNERSSHLVPTPRGGGCAVATAALVAWSASGRAQLPARAGLIVVAGGMSALGLIEDVRGVRPAARLALQLAIATAALPFLAHHLGRTPAWRVGLAFCVVVWLVAFTNSFNFMDGINGISTAQAIVGGVAYWALGRAVSSVPLEVGGLVVAGAAAGFAPFNFPHARMFLGDCGSYLLGGWLAVLSVVSLRSSVSPVAAVAPLALYVGDTAVTLVVRLAGGEVWHQAHRRHAYQRLVGFGWSHTLVTLLTGSVIAACSLIGGVTATAGPVGQVAAGAAVVALVAGYLWLPDALARHQRFPGWADAA